MWRLLMFAGLLAFLVVGCGPKENVPKTYPVTGKVVDAKGNPVKAGSVQFESKTDTTTTVIGEIQPDGNFSLRTFNNKMNAQGAQEGEYKVTINLPGVDMTNIPPPIIMPKPYRVEPKENNFELKLPK